MNGGLACALVAVLSLIGCSFLAGKVGRDEVEGCYVYEGRPVLRIQGQRLYDADSNVLITSFDFREDSTRTFLYIRPVVHIGRDGRGFRVASGEQWRLVPIQKAGTDIEILFPSGILTMITLEKSGSGECRVERVD